MLINSKFFAFLKKAAERGCNLCEVGDMQLGELMICNTCVLMICNLCEVGDIQPSGLMIYNTCVLMIYSSKS